MTDTTEPAEFTKIVPGWRVRPGDILPDGNGIDEVHLRIDAGGDPVEVLAHTANAEYSFGPRDPVTLLAEYQSMIEAVTKARTDQITKDGLISDTDEAFTDGDLIAVAGCYMIAASMQMFGAEVPTADLPPGWPDSMPPDAWAPAADPISNLVTACTYLMAEGDRWHRRPEPGEAPSPLIVPPEKKLILP